MSAIPAHPNTMQAFLNPAAAGSPAALAVLQKAGGFEPVLVAPEKLGAAIADAAAAGARRVLVAGGDGSLAIAASALIGTSTELAVLPAGTLNHFAKDLGIPTDHDDALALAAEGTVREVDVGRVNDHVFLNTCSVGAYVLFVRTRERLEKRFGYALASGAAFIRILTRLPRFRVRFLADDIERAYRSPVVFVGVGERELRAPQLGARVEGGARGLHVLVVRGRTRAQLLTLALAAIARGVRPLARGPHIDSFLLDDCRIEMRRPIGNVALDGEIVSLRAPLVFRLDRSALRVVAPSESAATPLVAIPHAV